MRKTFAILLSTLGILIVTTPVSQAQTYLSASPNPATSGQTVTLTASVYPPSCYGVITFMDYGSQIGIVSLDGNGNATMQTSSLSVGTNSLTASYDGEGDCDPSLSSVFSEVVNPVGPNISSLSPSQGGQGMPFTINGSGFGGQGTVTMNGVAATVNTWGTTVITAVVPNLAVGTFPVIVTVNGTASNSANFTVTPYINSLTLTQGPLQMGFTINGTNFGDPGPSSYVTVNTTKVLSTSAISWGNTAITLQVPAGAATGYVTVTVPGVPASSNGVLFTVTPGFGCP